MGYCVDDHIIHMTLFHTKHTKKRFGVHLLFEKTRKTTDNSRKFGQEVPGWQTVSVSLMGPQITSQAWVESQFTGLKRTCAPFPLIYIKV